MTDAMSPENEAPAPDFSADDAKYAEMEARYAPKEEPAPKPEPELQAEAAPAEDKRPPLPPEELEKRWRQSQAAMKEERRKRQELEEKLAKVEPQTQAQQDQIIALIESLREDDEDPIEDIAALKKAMREFAARQKAEAEQERTQTQQMTAYQRFASSVAEAETEFRDTTPDYDDAQAFFKDSLRQELEALGLEGDELSAEFARQVTNVAQQALNRGKNPAEVVYQLAARRGYNSAPAPKAQEQAPVNQDAVDKAAEVIEKISKAQQASKSLSSAGSAVGGQKELTLANVSKLSGKELLQGYKALKEQAKRTGSYR